MSEWVPTLSVFNCQLEVTEPSVWNSRTRCNFGILFSFYLFLVRQKREKKNTLKNTFYFYANALPYFLPQVDPQMF